MAQIFLCYRRDDSAGFAGRLADALELEFGPGSVFRDVDDIRPGEDFIHAIESHIQQVGAVLVMIGPQWLANGAGHQRRLDEPGDFVRLEIEAALASGKPVIPLLVGGATMPSTAVLGEAITGLARRHAVVLSDSNWRGDVQRLVVSLHPLLPNVARMVVKRTRKIVIIAALLALLALAWAWATRVGWQARNTDPAASIAPSLQARSISGSWAARVKYDWGDEYDETFEFNIAGERLQGSATYQTGRLIIEQPELAGNLLSFITRSQEMLGSDRPWKEVTHRYSGQITPTKIHFTLESTGGYSIHPPINFTAQRPLKP